MCTLQRMKLTHAMTLAKTFKNRFLTQTMLIHLLIKAQESYHHISTTTAPPTQVKISMELYSTILFKTAKTCIGS